MTYDRRFLDSGDSINIRRHYSAEKGKNNVDVRQGMILIHGKSKGGG
jgi:hypothetical protein